MDELPEDPFGQGIVSFDDGPAAVGSACFELFNQGFDLVLVVREGNGFNLVGGRVQLEPRGRIEEG